MEITRDANGTAIKIVMRKPADMHQHLRQGALLKLVTPLVAERFATAIIMPNTIPPITTRHQIWEYRQEIKKCRPDLRALMTFYLTDTLESEDVAHGLSTHIAYGVKYYPRGLTTNSDKGVKNPADLWKEGTKPYMVLRILAEEGGVLLIHAADGLDKNGDELDPYDQEIHFMRETLPHIVDAHPELSISVEHVSTAQGADQVRQYGKNTGGRVGCALTAHHLLLDRRDVFRGGFNTHRSWMPIIQSKEHKEELRKLAAEGHKFVWLGSDSAPHPREKKEAACCASGVLMAHAGIELYIEAFEDMGALDDRFEKFACIYGPNFYGVTASEKKITLVREEWKVEKSFFAQETWSPHPDRPLDQEVIPFRLGETVRWKLVA